MASKTFNNQIKGYWRDEAKSSIPNHSGVYFVYVATYNSSTNVVALKRLIYIGESQDVNDRIKTHEKYDEWLTYVGSGEELCLSTTKIEEQYRLRVEAAYIFKHKPPVNTEYVNNFPFDQTTIISTGKTALLNTNFTVNRT